MVQSIQNSAAGALGAHHIVACDNGMYTFHGSRVKRHGTSNIRRHCTTVSNTLVRTTLHIAPVMLQHCINALLDCCQPGVMGSWHSARNGCQLPHSISQ
jgi:hypothetical protein